MGRFFPKLLWSTRFIILFRVLFAIVMQSSFKFIKFSIIVVWVISLPKNQIFIPWCLNNHRDPPPTSRFVAGDISIVRGAWIVPSGTRSTKKMRIIMQIKMSFFHAKYRQRANVVCGTASLPKLPNRYLCSLTSSYPPGFPKIHHFIDQTAHIASGDGCSAIE